MDRRFLHLLTPVRNSQIFSHFSPPSSKPSHSSPYSFVTFTGAFAVNLKPLLYFTNQPQYGNGRTDHLAQRIGKFFRGGFIFFLNIFHLVLFFGSI